MKSVLIFILLPLLATAALDNKTLVEFESGNKLLTSDVYKELTTEFDSNFLVSPFSVQTALALTQSGAKGETAAEVRQALRLPTTKEETEAVLQNLLPQLRSDQFTLQSANKIYVKENYPLLEEFKKTATDVYQAGIEGIDFEQNEEAAKKINEWVEEQTRDKIHDIVQAKELDETSRLVLINALYFKGNWSVPFKLLSTTSKEFFKSEKEVVKVETMHSTKRYNYYECTLVDAKFLELPFRGDEASMVVVLPNEKQGLRNLESKIDKVFTPRPFTEELVQVALPKFKIESSVDFVKVLKKLGVRRIFNETEADLSGISATKEQLVVSKILQKTFIDVSEEGVEAAAATIVHVPTLISARPPPVPETPKLFIADHPFIFYIKVKGVVLFGGRVTVPKDS